MTVSPESLGQELWGIARALSRDPASVGRVLDWALVTVTAVTPFADPDSPPAPAVAGIRGTGTGTGPAGETQSFIYGAIVPEVGDTAILVRQGGGVAFLEDAIAS